MDAVGSKSALNLFKEVNPLLNLPATRNKLAITNRIVDHIGSHSDTKVPRNW
jgi:hypothetical protein